MCPKFKIACMAMMGLDTKVIFKSIFFSLLKFKICKFKTSSSSLNFFFPDQNFQLSYFKFSTSIRPPILDLSMICKKICKKNVTTIYHFHCVCNVGSLIDMQYKIYGIKGFGVLDGSFHSQSIKII